MAINQEWRIRPRANTCSHSGIPFGYLTEFFTAIFFDNKNGEFSRNDYSAESWEALREEIQPFSFWKSLYVIPPEKEEEPEVVEKESAESLLRRLIEENEAHTENARYILAVMLERKKIFRQTDTQFTDQSQLLIYEHTRSGEVFIVRDPELKLDEVEHVQAEVATLLDSAGKPSPEKRLTGQNENTPVAET